MSVVRAGTGLLSLGPRVWFEDGVLHARTSLLIQLLCLFFWKRKVTVDPTSRKIVMRKRWFWIFFEGIEVDFDDISHVTYRFDSLTTSWNFFGHAEDSVESYDVGLALQDGSEVELFSFRGEGSKMTGLVGVALGDGAIDLEGTQGEQSLSYVDWLQELTQKGLSKGTHAYRRVR